MNIYYKSRYSTKGYLSHRSKEAFLMHKVHKYTSREWKNGRWVYKYDYTPNAPVGSTKAVYYYNDETGKTTGVIAKKTNNLFSKKYTKTDSYLGGGITATTNIHEVGILERVKVKATRTIKKYFNKTVSAVKKSVQKGKDWLAKILGI